MHEVLPQLLEWWRLGEPVGMGTVVATHRSAPRPPGASMLVGPDGSAVGSISGGCVEAAVFELASEVANSGIPTLRRYGVSDSEAFEVGLTCGGTLDVYVERVDKQRFPELREIAMDVDAGTALAVATVVEHTDSSRIGRRALIRPGEPISGSLGDTRIDDAIYGDAIRQLAHGQSATLEYGLDGEPEGEGQRVFVWAFSPKPRLVVFGAIDFAAALARVGHFLGYRVTVCDARSLFATRTRFPDADEVVVRWPHRYLAEESAAGRIDARTAICVLTHDPKFDLPLLDVALRLSEVGYVGAMGSRSTHDDREARLRAAGLTDVELERLASPIGLDLGAHTPEETAISIVAEIIARRTNRTGRPLRGEAGRIHGDG